MESESSAAARIVDAIAARGHVVEPAFVPEAIVAALRGHASSLDAQGALRAAAIGRRDGRIVAPATRGDRICWLDDASAVACEEPVRDALETVRIALNRTLMLGLRGFEAHYAIYPPGAHYARHRDRFRDDDARVLSFVLYLNDRWHADDGGALRVHLPEHALDVLPEGGTLVAFLSERFEHEVLPARRERLSLTGWFKRGQGRFSPTGSE